MKSKFLIFLVLFFSSRFDLRSQCLESAYITTSDPLVFYKGGSITLTAHPQGDTWIRKADFKGDASFGAVGISIGNKGYIGTGDIGMGSETDQFWEYNPTNDFWTKKASLLGFKSYYGSGFSIGTAGFIKIGRTLSTFGYEFFMYNQSANIWTRMPDYSNGKNYTMSSVGFSIDSKGYIGLGLDTGGNHLNELWEYEATSNTWTEKANFPGNPRSESAAFVIDGMAYVGCGWKMNQEIYSDFWQYNPIKDTWIQKASFGGKTKTHPIAFVIGGKGYAGLGSGDTCYGRGCQDFWEYDPVKDTWIEKSRYKGTNLGHNVGFSIGCKGYVGGTPGMNNGVNEFWEYTPSSTYLWSTGQRSASIAVDSSSVYTLTVTDACGCTSSSSITVTVLDDGPFGLQIQILPSGSKVKDLKAIGSNIKWYDSLKSIEPLSQDFLLEHGKYYFATQTISNLESKARLKVRVEMTSLINEVTLPNFQLFPNPVVNTLKILTKEEDLTFSISDFLGRELKQSKLENYTINLQDLNEGVYIIEILDKNQNLMIKNRIIIQR